MISFSLRIFFCGIPAQPIQMLLQDLYHELRPVASPPTLCSICSSPFRSWTVRGSLFDTIKSLCMIL
jgi:hypothetical protein